MIYASSQSRLSLDNICQNFTPTSHLVSASAKHKRFILTPSTQIIEQHGRRDKSDQQGGVEVSLTKPTSLSWRLLALLTPFLLSAIFHDPDRALNEFQIPVLQCLQVKPLGAQPNGGGERYRIVLSDTINYVQCMLATQANHVVHDGKLNKCSIVRVKSYNPNTVKGKRYDLY